MFSDYSRSCQKKSVLILNNKCGTRRQQRPCYWLGTTDINLRGIKGAFDMRRVKFLSHLDAGAAIFGDLVDVSTLHQPHTNVSIPRALGHARLLFAVLLEFCPFQNAIEEFDIIAREDGICELEIFQRSRLGGIARQALPARALLFPAPFSLHRLGSTKQPLIKPHGATPNPRRYVSQV